MGVDLFRHKILRQLCWVLQELRVGFLKLCNLVVNGCLPMRQSEDRQHRAPKCCPVDFHVVEPDEDVSDRGPTLVDQGDRQAPCNEANCELINTCCTASVILNSGSKAFHMKRTNVRPIIALSE